MSPPDDLLAGRVAIITGGAGGIGAAIVRAFAGAGATGAVIDQPGTTPEVPETWLAVSADVRRAASLEAAFASVERTFERLDIVVANAGIVPPWTSTADIDLEEWEHVFAVNSRGVMLTVRQAVRAMTGRAMTGRAMTGRAMTGRAMTGRAMTGRAMTGRGGAIVAMSSLNGWRGDPHIPAYVASKHAVVGLVKSVAADVGRLGIRVNAVAPGPIATDALLSRMTARAAAGGVTVEQALESAAAATALGRVATVEEVAGAVLFLASDLSSGITGQLLPVDAGIL